MATGGSRAFRDPWRHSPLRVLFREHSSGLRVDPVIYALGILTDKYSPEIVLALRMLDLRKPFGSGAVVLFHYPELRSPRLFFVVGFLDWEENLSHPKAPKGGRWPEVMSVLFYFSNLVGPILPHRRLTDEDQIEASSKFHGGGGSGSEFLSQ